LVGREWSHGVLDCYALVRDWFRAERGVELPNFVRFDDWWKRGENLYLEKLIAWQTLQITYFRGKNSLFFAVFAQTLRCAPEQTHGFMRQNVK